MALLTDFGAGDWYASSIKAAALSVNPEIKLVDISHEIKPGPIAEGAFVLARCFDDFPPGTTFVVVDDPGVGTGREPIAVFAGEYYFVGPNNGVLYPVVGRFSNAKAVKIENPDWMGKKSSATFHGRDLFAPVGSHLAGGGALEEAGPALDKLVDFAFSEPVNLNGYLHGRILYFDRFGNGLTNFQKGRFESENLLGFRVAGVIFPIAKHSGRLTWVIR